MDVTIVIPTKNAGKLLDKVLSRVFRQETSYEYEVICVDSGSKDGTLDVIRKYPCRLVQIAAEDFGHGKTRNYGASLGTGEYIVFLTQDALPASKKWLQNFIDAMKLDEDIVGGFGIHYPYPDCNIFDKRDLKAHFENFGLDNTVFYLDDKERYDREEGYRHYLAFFSDNNSCVKRTAFEADPYDDVNFAEDQIWMRRQIEKGHKKVYCPKAPVYHSHNYDVSTYFQRYFDEYKGLYEVHGYIIAKHWFLLPAMAAKHVLDDARWLRHQPIGKKKKIYWAWYSFRRNLARYFGGYIGGTYHRRPKKIQQLLDRMISQQYRQRKE